MLSHTLEEDIRSFIVIIKLHTKKLFCNIVLYNWHDFASLTTICILVLFTANNWFYCTVFYIILQNTAAGQSKRKGKLKPTFGNFLAKIGVIFLITVCPSCSILNKIHVWWKFFQNSLSGLDARSGHGILDNSVRHNLGIIKYSTCYVRV